MLLLVFFLQWHIFFSDLLGKILGEALCVAVSKKSGNGTDGRKLR